MRCLWLTWADPRLEHGGQEIYSSQLISALAEQGMELTVLCFAQSGGRTEARDDGTIQWRLVRQDHRPSWASVFSTLPHVAHRSATRAMRAHFKELLDEWRWHSVVLDGLYMGWALPIFERRYARDAPRPRMIYVSHNHEESLRALMARNYAGNPVYKSLLYHDWHKVRRLEHRMVDAADAVTAITQDDAARYRVSSPRTPIYTLPPGYRGRRVAQRQITDAVPRRAVVLGTFDWMAKRMNLQEFLTVADPMFGEAGAALTVVGRGDPDFLSHLRAKFKNTALVGEVDKVDPYLDSSRIAIVPERTGGGFKLRVLDYVFSRLPIAALEGSVAGTPLRADESILTFGDHKALVDGVLKSIDDLKLLNRIQESAYSTCADHFDWQRRGAQLFGLLSA